jgi:hypothetical protein
VEAMPLRPVAEYDLHRLLDRLEAEFQDVLDDRPSWTERWRGLPLPRTTVRSSITAVGYTYENLTFELARDDVLELFTGAQLYGNAQAFVRELLQNAMDAVRLRALLDRRAEHGRVDITCWEEDGAIWFRIDDDGVGMDLANVRDYFLRIGRSYYNSDDLARELRRQGQGESRFRAISRFGIGIMSCFLLGDRVEVSTRRVPSTEVAGTPLRLSLTKREDFVVLRHDGEGHDPMPSRPGDPSLDFRETPGTTVAVRIDATQHHVRPGSLLTQAESFHFGGGAAVTLNGHVHQGRNLAEPIIDSIRSREIDFTRESPFRAGCSESAQVWAIPLDLTSASPDPRVAGQLLATVATLNGHAEGVLADLWPLSVLEELHPTVRRALGDTAMTRSAGADLTDAHVWCDVAYEDMIALLERFGLREIRQLQDADDRVAAVRAEFDKSRSHPYSDTDVAVLAEIVRFHQSVGSKVLGTAGHGLAEPLEPISPQWWGHNGISLPLRRRHEFLDEDQPEVDFDVIRLPATALADRATLTGHVAFSDDLRPDLSLSRDEVRSIPFSMAAALMLAVRRAVPSGTATALTHRVRSATEDPRFLPREEVALLGTVLDGIDAVPAGWSAESVFLIRGREYSYQEVARRAADGPVTLDPFRDPTWGHVRPAVTELIASALAQRHLDLVWETGDPRHDSGRCVVVSGDEPLLPAGLRLFRPLFFVRFRTGGGLLDDEFFSPYNIEHPFSRWLVQHASELHLGAPGHFARLREIMVWLLSPGELPYQLRDLERRDGVALTEYPLSDIRWYAEMMRPTNPDEDERITMSLPVGYALLRYTVERIAHVAPDLAPSDEVRASLDELVERHRRAADGYRRPGDDD